MSKMVNRSCKKSEKCQKWPIAREKSQKKFRKCAFGLLVSPVSKKKRFPGHLVDFENFEDEKHFFFSRPKI